MNPPADGPDHRSPTPGERERRLTAAADALRALPPSDGPSDSAGHSPVRLYHGAMAATWAAYTAVWALSYAVPMPAALFTVKALIGVSLITALESSFGALHAAKAAR